MTLMMHFYLHLVKLTFVDSEGNTGTTDVSVVIQSERNIVTIKELSQAQQGAQQRLFANIGEVTVINAVNSNVCYLGQMTEDEFSHKAEGMTVVAPDAQAPAND